MATFHKIIICGRLVRDAETVPFRNGQGSFVKFDLYTKEYAGKDKERRSEFWNNLQIWNDNLQTWAATLKQGDEVYVEATRETSKYNDKTGAVKTSYSFKVKEIHPMGQPKNAQGDGDTYRPPTTRTAPQPAAPVADSEMAAEFGLGGQEDLTF